MVHVGGPTEWSGTRQEAVHLRQPRYGLPNSDVEMAFIVGQQFASCRHADPIQEIQCESSHRDQDHTEKDFLTCPGLCHIFSLFGGCVAGICCHSPSGEDHTHHQLMGMKKKK